MATRVSAIFALLALLSIGFVTVQSADGAVIVWVTENTDGSNPPSPDDIGWTDLLTANGHQVVRRDNRILDPLKIAEMEAADLVIVSRDTNSENYDDLNEETQWNSITTPLMLMNQLLLRNSRWKWLNTRRTAGSGDGVIEVTDPAHPIFSGMTLDGLSQVDIATSSTPAGGTSNVGNGMLLARDPDTSNVTIALWTVGTEFYARSGQTAGGTRMFFGAGADGNNPKGALNMTAEGETLFLNSVNFLAPPTIVPEPSAYVVFSSLFAYFGIALYWRSRRLEGQRDQAIGLANR